MQDIYIVGIGMTPFGKFRDKPIRDMTARPSPPRFPMPE